MILEPYCDNTDIWVCAPRSVGARFISCKWHNWLPCCPRCKGRGVIVLCRDGWDIRKSDGWDLEVPCPLCIEEGRI